MVKFWRRRAQPGPPHAQPAVPPDLVAWAGEVDVSRLSDKTVQDAEYYLKGYRHMNLAKRPQLAGLRNLRKSSGSPLGGQSSRGTLFQSQPVRGHPGNGIECSVREVAVRSEEGLEISGTQGSGRLTAGASRLAVGCT
jgi:hypothetical protein